MFRFSANMQIDKNIYKTTNVVNYDNNNKVGLELSING